jgi:hypothetical protein
MEGLYLGGPAEVSPPGDPDVSEPRAYTAIGADFTSIAKSATTTRGRADKDTTTKPHVRNLACGWRIPNLSWNPLRYKSRDPGR